MTAQALVDAWGKKLIGRRVVTIAIGEYPGGVATVTEILPDPGAPEIVFQVKHPTYGPMGVFNFEPCELHVSTVKEAS